MPHDDFQTEAVRGLPERPPEGERIVWQGAPAWRSLARSWLRTRWVGGWFVLLAAWRSAAMAADGATGTEILAVVVWLLGLGAAAVAVLWGIAYVTAKATVYTVTTRRVAMRIGTALTLTLNLPFRWIVSADLRLNRDGTGDIPLTLGGNDKLSWLMLWPHARPWKLAKPQPMLRAIPEAGRVATLLAEALRAEVARLQAEGVPLPGGAAETAPGPRPAALRPERTVPRGDPAAVPAE